MSSKEITFDGHTHTLEGSKDAEDSAYVMYRRAKKFGFYPIFFTDHNSTAGVEALSLQLSAEENSLIIPGFELSLLSSHYLIWGIAAQVIAAQLEEWEIPPASDKAIVNKSKLKDILRWAVDQEGVIIASHPCVFFPGSPLSANRQTLAELFEAGLLHGAEAHNYKTERMLARISIILAKIWHRRTPRILAELGILAFAHSDAHRVGDLGAWHTKLTIPDNDSLIEAIRERRVLAVEHLRRGY